MKKSELRQMIREEMDEASIKRIRIYMGKSSVVYDSGFKVSSDDKTIHIYNKGGSAIIYANDIKKQETANGLLNIFLK